MALSPFSLRNIILSVLGFQNHMARRRAGGTTWQRGTCVGFGLKHSARCLSHSRYSVNDWCACVLSHFSRVRLFAAGWTVALQAPLSIGFSRWGYWSGLPCPPPGDLLTQGSNPHLLGFLHWQVGFLPLAPPGKSSVGLKWLIVICILEFFSSIKWLWFYIFIVFWK